MSETRNTSVGINTMDLHLEYFVVQGLTCEHIDTIHIRILVSQPFVFYISIVLRAMLFCNIIILGRRNVMNSS